MNIECNECDRIVNLEIDCGLPEYDIMGIVRYTCESCLEGNIEESENE